MSLTNTRENFGWVSIGLHWLLAVALIAMYFVGDWMVGLDYYSPWYKVAPDLHRSVGVLVGALMVMRLLWNHIQVRPEPLGHQSPLMRRLATAAHHLLYLMVFIIVVSGYLISTAKGQGVDVFGLFEIPALLGNSVKRGELAGDIHEYLALAFILLVVLHALAAIVHHLYYKDRTLKRMLGIKQ
ncbi:MAG: cytochrome b [Proteobacteria bacterium]|nr:MAG: cytochrome b [Pseudomonadota bacterium]